MAKEKEEKEDWNKYGPNEYTAAGEEDVSGTEAEYKKEMEQDAKSDEDDAQKYVQQANEVVDGIKHHAKNVERYTKKYMNESMEEGNIVKHDEKRAEHELTNDDP